MVSSVLKKLAALAASTAMLSAGVAYGSTPQYSSQGADRANLLAQDTCVTDAATYPTSDADVVYVTADTTCFNEKGGILVDDEVFAIEYDDAIDYFYIDYDGVDWYFIEWDGAILLTDGEDYVVFSFID